jgi:hypothetical protein
MTSIDHLALIIDVTYSQNLTQLKLGYIGSTLIYFGY